MPGLQEWIYKLEEGGGAQIVKVVALVLVFVGLAVFQDVRRYKSFNTQEAMDTAQVARNVAEGRGFTTQFVRPLSIYLIQKNSPDANPRLREDHPDIANAPVYPYVLAGLMKVLPFNFEIPGLMERTEKPFVKYQPEIIIAIFNQALFLLAAFLVFRIANRLFDSSVAWISTIVFIGAELFWRFTLSGLSTMLLVVIFLGLAWLLIKIDEKEREEEPAPAPVMLGLAVAIGVTVGIAGLTRYSFAWLMIPVIVFLGAYISRNRTGVILSALVAFLLVMTPWLARNYSVSGTLFGTAGYAATATTLNFPEHRLERSLNPEQDLKKVVVFDYVRKLINNGKEILQTHLPGLGGSWVGAFFLVGLMIPFRDPALSRMRLFLVVTLLVFVVVQALSQTHLAAESPGINSENLLAVFAPLIFVFGVGLFFILLEQLVVPIPQLRQLVVLAFALVASAPLLVSVAQSKVTAAAYPPYYPPIIKETAGWMKERDTVMSDVPWAVAWYGNRQSVWLTLDPRDEFFRLHDEIKSVQALYLTPKTMNRPFAQEMVRDKTGWGRFMLEVIARGEVPQGFPLKTPAAGFLPDQFFITDWERWKLQNN